MTIVNSGVDTTHNFVWAKVNQFSVFTIGDAGLVDTDGDGLNSWFELKTPHSAKFEKLSSSSAIYSKGDPLYVRNDRIQHQIPSGDINWRKVWILRIAYGTVDLFSLGFNSGDFATTNTWRLTDGGSTTYASVSTKKVLKAFSPSLTFEFIGMSKYMRIDVRGYTDPNDADTDDDGLSDGAEVLSYGTSPIDDDTDDDQWSDGAEINKYYTNPNNPDTDGDGTSDSKDYDPLVNLHVYVYIKEILQSGDWVDGWPNKKGDFYVKVAVNGVWKKSKQFAGDDAHVYPRITYGWDVPDGIRIVDVTIQLWDNDPKPNPDDHVDISGWGKTLDLHYNVRTGMWSGEDYYQDRNGFGHASGHEDGSYGWDDNDCDIWFDIYQNDYDSDRIPYLQEILPNQGKLERRADGSYYSGGALYVKNNRAQYRIPSGYIKYSGGKTYGTVDLFELGFNEGDFATANTWQITRGSRVYASLSTPKINKVESASLYFELKRYGRNHYMSIEVTYYTDPRVWDWDSDLDGMPDWWELRYGLDRINPGDAGGDADHDRLINKAEYGIGTDPRFFEINLWVSLNWDASSSYMSKIAKGIRKASDFIYDVTDGRMYFRYVLLRDNSAGYGTADVQVDSGGIWPQASVGGIDSSGDHIYMPQYFNGKDTKKGNPDGGSWYKTLAHEFGHYGMYFYDEYIDADGNEYPGHWWTGIPKGPKGFMNYQYDYSEMTTDIDYSKWSPPSGYKTTKQYDLRGMSCWAYFLYKYNAKIWIDLDNNGVRDTTFLSSYKAIGGPGTLVDGGYTKITTVNT